MTDIAAVVPYLRPGSDTRMMAKEARQPSSAHAADICKHQLLVPTERRYSMRRRHAALRRCEYAKANASSHRVGRCNADMRHSAQFCNIVVRTYRAALEWPRTTVHHRYKFVCTATGDVACQP